MQTLAGDSSDDIPGIKGVGMKNKLLPEGGTFADVIQIYIDKGYTKEDAILTRRLVGLDQYYGTHTTLWMPIIGYLKENFEYTNGNLVRVKTAAPNAKVGDVVGSLDQSTGYLKATIDKKQYYVHRLIWMYHYGYIDSDVLLDHKDRDKLNNDINNLRIVTKQENGFNTDAKGYYFHKEKRKYKAQIMLSGKQIHIGYYDTEGKARRAYKKAKQQHHKIEE